MSALTTLIHHSAKSSDYAPREGKKRKERKRPDQTRYADRKGNNLSLFVDDMIAFVEIPRNSCVCTHTHTQISGYKINIDRKSTVFIHTGDEHMDSEM